MNRAATSYFEAQFPVRFHDIDRAGIVFFATIIAYCHVAFEDLLTSVNYPPKRFYDQESLGAPFVKVVSEFHAPLRHGDTLVIRASVIRLGGASIHLRYRIFNQHEALCATIETTQSCIDLKQLRGKRIPESLRTALNQYSEDQIPLSAASDNSC